MFITILKNSKVKLGGVKKMIKIPIGINADGNTVCVKFIQLDPRFGTLTNKTLAAIQTEIIKEERKELAKQKGAIVF